MFGSMRIPADFVPSVRLDLYEKRGKLSRLPSLSAKRPRLIDMIQDVPHRAVVESWRMLSMQSRGLISMYLGLKDHRKKPLTVIQEYFRMDSTNQVKAAIEDAFEIWRRFLMGWYEPRCEWCLHFYPVYDHVGKCHAREMAWTVKQKSCPSFDPRSSEVRPELKLSTRKA